MPGYLEILEEIDTSDSKNALNNTRYRYLTNLSTLTERNIIAYYSNFLGAQNQNPAIQINDRDVGNFMAVIKGLDKSKGLDLILHTPGGNVAATEALIKYLHSIFDGNIRAIIPQIAMSGGTMMACACKEIIMGKQSSLGPIDPQMGMYPASGIVEEFREAVKEVGADPNSLPIWQTIINKYPPTILGQCQKALDWAQEIAKNSLVQSMFKNDRNKQKKAEDISIALANHQETKAHSRHLSLVDCQKIGLKVIPLEDDSELQDAVLSVHHSYMIALDRVPGIIKIIENQNGKTMVEHS